MSVEIFNFEQGSDEWKNIRAGVVTASCLGDVLAKGQGKTRRTYMMTLLGERLTGKPSDGFSNKHTERGHELEPEARNLYQFMTDNECTKVGFMKRGDVGASPDSLIGDNGLLEIKTRLPHLQCETLLSGEMPPGHAPQVQGQLLVSEREWVDFCSYWPGLPLFLKRIHRDEVYIAELERETNIFLYELNELCNQLTRKYIDGI